MWFRKAEKDPAPDLAVKDAHENLARIRARGPEVQELVTRDRCLRVANHFSEQLNPLMGP